MRAWALFLTLAACHHATPRTHVTPIAADDANAPDPDGPHRQQIAEQVQPFLDADIASSIVVGIYDAGKKEIYGFGHGPNNKPPDGKTLYELGSITKVYTSLLFAAAIQDRVVDLDTPLADLLPPGVTAPTKDKVAVTLHHLALHTSGLPRIPPSLMAPKNPADPYADYNEEAMYRDLVQTTLASTPGERVDYSNFGAGVLGFVLGKKLDGTYAASVKNRIFKPLGQRDTFVGVPPSDKPRMATGADEDLKPVPPWTFDALAGAGALDSDVRDQLALVDAELDAASGGTSALRKAMKLTQEPQLDVGAGQPNEGLGWQIDRNGRYWHNGATAGFHAFVGFDVKLRRGVVILAAASNSLIDHLADTLYAVMDGTAKKPPHLATAADIADFAGSYDLGGEPLQLVAAGNRFHVEGRGEPPHRLYPISDHEFWIEALSAVAVFERDITTRAVTKLVFVIGDRQLLATRVNAPPPAPAN